MGWGNICKRRIKVFSLAFMVYLDYKALQQREKWTRNSKRAALWEKAHERNAKRVLNLIIQLEGLWVKLGQYLSTRADVLPEAYISLLKQLQDSLPPRPLEEVCGTIKKELGRTIDDLFLDFVESPLATASIAQVHRATLSNGQEVVVKVQHEGIKTIILEDLKNAKSIVDWIAWAEPQYDFNPMIDEWCKEAPKELDFIHEAENTRTVSRNLGCKNKGEDNTIANHVDVLIPEVIQATEKVLILEYMDGVRLNDSESLDALGVDKQKLVEEITRAYAHQIYVDGFFNGDPHPGNFLVSREPPHRPILLDFGLTKFLSSSVKHALAKMFLASAERQVEWEKIAKLCVMETAGLMLIQTQGSIILQKWRDLSLLSPGDGGPNTYSAKGIGETYIVANSSIMMAADCNTVNNCKEVEDIWRRFTFKFLALKKGDHVALLSAFAEMGLKLRLDLPEQAMEVMNVFFRTSTPASAALENMKSLVDQRAKGMKVIQEKMKLNQKQVKRFNPIDAFPGDIVIFSRVINLLRGLSSTMNVRIAYLDTMRPFAESVLQGDINKGPALNTQWVYDTPVHSDVEAKLRQLLVELGNGDKILGIQVCAYKDGEVIIDTAAGVLGRYDPRPVQLDSLFPVFSVTKGITAGMLHWLVDHGKLKLEENVANIWPEFRSNGKDLIKVHHVLNHTSGLHNALASLTRENPLLMSDWDECLSRIATSVPETEPGREQLYHYLSFGWLCGGIIEHASGKKFQEILEEAFIHPLQIEGELYIGIPPGVESRLATLTVDMDDLSKLSEMSSRPDLPSTFQLSDISQLATSLPVLFNTLNIRRAIIPAANGHCSARALARYYATLVDSGVVPPPHSSSSQAALGSHPHIPKFPTPKTSKKQKGGNSKSMTASSSRTSTSESMENYINSNHGGYHETGRSNNYIRVSTDSNGGSSKTLSTTGSCINVDGGQNVSNIFSNPRIHDAFLGAGEYDNLVYPNGKFGLGFRRLSSPDGSCFGFGHSGMGGSTGYCDMKNRFAIAVTLNKMSFGGVTGNIIQLVCSELNIPLPEEYSRSGQRGPADMQLNMEKPLIN